MLSISFSKNLILIWFVIAAIAISFSLSFYRYYFAQDYLLYIKVPCDQAIESCFIEECSEEDVRCILDENEQFIYKILYKQENTIPDCSGEGCPIPVCEDNDKHCFYVFCSEEVINEYKLEASCSQ